jgi:membrane protease YdiL (CAAX protease family)
MPKSPRERAWYSALSLAAGLCEELVFRGFLLGVLAIAWGSVAAASLASAAVFGVVHGYQGMAGAVRAAVLGVVLTVPVLVTGSLIPSMVAHFALDMILGLLLADRLLD